MKIAQPTSAKDQRDPATLTTAELNRFMAKYKSRISTSFGSKSFVCIARKGKIGRFDFDCLFVAPDGNLVLVLSAISAAEIVSEVKILRAYGFNLLNELSANYTFLHKGQAADVIDIMASRGLLSYADETDFEAKIASGISSGKILVLAVGISQEDRSSLKETLSKCRTPLFDVFFIDG